MDIRHYYEDPSILHEGTLPARASFKSFGPDAEAPSERSLNGEWRFSFYESVRLGRQALADGSFRKTADTVHVPSTWQHTGYDSSQYINTRYPFPADPPFVPAQNPMGIYEREFNISAEELSGTVILRFDGVDSCFFLFINEAYAGYSQVSHSMSEFDITEKLHEGGNLITVCVLKWCDGSYLECQDKFRESGIFRDVDLLVRPKEYIFDYTVTACPDESLEHGTLTVTLDRKYSFPVMCSLYYNGKNVARVIIGAAADSAGAEQAETPDSAGTEQAETPDSAGTEQIKAPDSASVTLNIDKPVLWNAELPELYQLTLSTPFERIIEKVGFRRIDIREGIFYINNVRCKLRGVNYHDSNPYAGARLTKEQAVMDLTLMKRANINAIRTSHYPKPHWFMEMCDMYGFYIVDEADIEAHGSSYIYVDGEREVSAISRMPEFTGAYVDRIRRLYERDKNHASVIIWSLGNESGYGENFIEGAKLLHSRKDGRPVHYEAADRTFRFSLPVDEIDVYSNMYAPLERVEDYCTRNPLRLKRPYMQCEFCHAMGNGPGDLFENVEQLYNYEHYFGAFVWEWCDHAVFDGVDGNGYEHFLYGGDSGEKYHDGNFCMDGLVFPDRRVHTGYLEYKNVIRPVRLKSFDRADGTAEFENMYDFADAFAKLRIFYEIKENGRLIRRGELCSEMSFPAKSSITLSLPEGGISDSQYVIFRYMAKEPDALVEEGFERGFDEVEPLAVELPGMSAAAPAFSAQDSRTDVTSAGDGGAGTGPAKPVLSMEESDYEFRIQGPDFTYIFDRELGAFSGMLCRDRLVITRPMEFNVLRAYMDNDRNIKQTWEKCGYDDLGFKAYGTEAAVCGSSVVISFSGALAAPHRSPALRLSGTWTVTENGTVTLKLDAKRNENMEYLPRFGIRMFIPKELETAEYFGYGPRESYCDKHRSTILDLYRQNIDEMGEPYVKPQETGSHFGTRCLTVSDDSTSIFVTGPQPFSFSLSRYTAQKMNAAAHIFELEEEPDNVLCIDYRTSGCGSASCGPELNEKYRFSETEFEWEIMLAPFCNQEK